MIKFNHTEIEEVVKMAVACTTDQLESMMMDTFSDYEQNRLNLARKMVALTGDHILEVFNILAEEQLKSSELQEKIRAIDLQLAQIASKLRPVDEPSFDEDGIRMEIGQHNNPEVD